MDIGAGTDAGTDIAVVGMAGRFPGARDVDELWQRVAAGDDCLTDLDPAEQLAAGVPASVVSSPAYVARAGILDDVEGFDHRFFGIGARDAAVMDPQHRHFLECAWEALESAAIVPERFEGAIGVFGGCGMNTYLINNLLTNGTVLEQLGWFLLRHTGNDKDFLTNNVAYRLDLRGPAVNVQTACSTSLVAVHLAVQSLLSFESDLALAGGATIEAPHGRGYLFREGEILAPDGICRAFDERSAGTVITGGAAVVALRRFADAIADGDPVLAVIKGTAINNDGSRKVGFLAPSVDGHRDVILEALEVAGLSARDLQLFEAHGTGTSVGDPIEVAAATEAFRRWTDDRGFCRITSTKPNVGHLDTAAGAVSLIKVVQALRHRTLPPLANHTAPSPLIDFAASPFHLSASAEPWSGDRRRRAGVSSLGAGGTNAHVVVEEAPPLDEPTAAVPEQVLSVSALTAEALDAASARLADHLADHLEAGTDLDLAAVSQTLCRGRRAMPHRLVATATDLGDAVRVLRDRDRHRSSRSVRPDGPVRLGFMFGGGGSQYAGMAEGLDERFSTFHDVRREAVGLVRQAGGIDLTPLLSSGCDPEALRPPTASLPAVFVTSVALARQWMAFGAQPDLLVGHSLGEYVAAHLAGVMSLDDAIRLVVVRAGLMERASGSDAAMLVVPLSEAELVEVLPPSLSLAVVNAADECVVAGRLGEVEKLARLLDDRDTPGTLIPLAAAAHSSLLDPILDEFAETVRSVTLNEPQLPYPSNLTGTWITPGQATDPQYWVDHLRGTVRFADCVRTVVGDSKLVLSELGPGQALSSLARRADPGRVAAIPTLRHPEHRIPDTAFTLHAFARQWAEGVEVDLAPFSGGPHRRLRLPTYPFQHERCWIEPGVAPIASGTSAPPAPVRALPRRIDDLDDACWTVDWDPVDAPRPVLASGDWAVLGDDGDPLVSGLAAELTRRGVAVSVVGDGEPLPAEAAGVVLVAPTGPDTYTEAVHRWFAEGTRAVEHLGAAPGSVRLVALTRDALAVHRPAGRPADAMAVGIALVAQREYPGLTSRVVDVTEPTDLAALVDDVLGEGPEVVAHRDGARLTPTTRPAAVPPPAAEAVTFQRGGTYLVTGALGGVGHVLATHLAAVHQADLVLVSSAAVPDGAERASWLADHAYDDPTSRRIRQIAAIEEHGTKVAVVVADLADPASVGRALDEAELVVGHIDGAVHAAGRLRDRLIELADPDDHDIVLGAKARGALVLADELARRGADLLLLVSSTSTVLAPEGQASYVAANAVLDALGGWHENLRVATINYGLWADIGVASDIARRARLGLADGEPVDHPVFSERQRRPDGTTVLTGRVDAGASWILDEHRMSGVAVYPGTGHLHLMFTAIELAGLHDVELADVALLAPLAVHDGDVVTIRADVAPDGTVEILSDAGGRREWTLHSQASIVPAVELTCPGDPRAELATLPAAGRDLLEAQRAHVTFGSRWESVVEARCGDGVVVARLRLPGAAADREATRWSPHPALLDVATAAGIALAPTGDAPPLLVPAGYQRVSVRWPLPEEIVVRAVEADGSTADRLRVDISAVDAAGNPCLAIGGLELVGISGGTMLDHRDEQHPGSTPAPASVVDWADDLGLRPADGVELVERLLASDHHRMIGSTIGLDDLRRRFETDGDGSGGEAAASQTSDVESLERALIVMWSELLGLEEVGLDDDFFDLGGHSLIAIRLMARIHSELGVRLRLAAIFDAPTVATLSATLRDEDPGIDANFAGGGSSADTSVPSARSRPASPRSLVPISTRGPGRPLYVVHGAGGNVLFLGSFGRAMSGKRPVYGFQAHGIDQDDTPDESIGAMAARYLADLRSHGPGPYLLSGYSGGGIVALEMARLLEAEGERVDAVVLFDSPVGRISLGRRVHARHLLHNVREHGFAPVVPIVRSRLQASTLGRYALFRGRKSEHQRSHEVNYEEMLAHGFNDLFDHFTGVFDRHPVGNYAIDVILVKSQLRWPLMSADYGWGAHIDGALDVIVAPGDHESMFHGSNVDVLVAALEPLLARHG